MAVVRLFSAAKLLGIAPIASVARVMFFLYVMCHAISGADAFVDAFADAFAESYAESYYNKIFVTQYSMIY